MVCTIKLKWSFYLDFLRPTWNLDLVTSNMTSRWPHWCPPNPLVSLAEFGRGLDRCLPEEQGDHIEVHHFKFCRNLSWCWTVLNVGNGEWFTIRMKNHPSNPRSLPSTRKFVRRIDGFLINHCRDFVGNLLQPGPQEYLGAASQSGQQLLSPNFLHYVYWPLGSHLGCFTSHRVDPVDHIIISCHILISSYVGFDWNPPSSKETTRLCSMVLFASTPPF